MEIRREFLIRAIEEVQETNRFLDTKAGVLVAFESFLLAFAAFSVVEKSVLDSVQNVFDEAPGSYVFILGASFAGYLIALVFHVIYTLRVIFPQENPAHHVVYEGFQPHGLFFIYELDEQQQIQPSIPAYARALTEMSDSDILQEYAFEFLKLSYIRKHKSDGLMVSFWLLQTLIVGTALLVLLYVLGLLAFT